MYELLWLLLGAAATLGALRALARPALDPAERQRGRPASTPPTPESIGTAAASPPSVAEPRTGGAVTPAVPSRESRQLVLSLADELANLVSGVEGKSHDLIEAAADVTRVPLAAEALVAATQRLRTLHRKLQAFGHLPPRPAPAARVTLPDVVARLREELQHLQLGLELRWDPPPHLADIAVAAETVHDALTFLCVAMLRTERGATRLSVISESCFAGSSPSLKLELVLEWSAEAPKHTAQLLADPAVALDLEACYHLITSHGGELSLQHLPGRSVRAEVRWPMALPEPAAHEDAPATASKPALPRPRSHLYGGALVLEADPAVRAMLARELKASGRAVFACADGASASSFLQATPDRFELLIVDDPHRLGAGDPLATTIQELAPALKIFALAPGQAALPGWPHLHHLQKPFGVHELRAALASVLAAG